MSSDSNSENPVRGVVDLPVQEEADHVIDVADHGNAYETEVDADRVREAEVVLQEHLQGGR